MLPRFAAAWIRFPDRIAMLSFAALFVGLGSARPLHADVAWTLQTADAAYGAGWTTSLRLNSAGLPCVAEWAAGTGIRYATFDGSNWSGETVGFPPAADVGVFDRRDHGARRGPLPASIQLLITSATALALDSSDTPWIVSATTDELNLYPPPRPVQVAHRVGTTWSTESLEPGVGYPAAAFDGLGRLHVCFDGGLPSSHVLRYAVRDAGVWSYDTVDVHGAGPSLGVDAQGVPHVAYWDGSRGALVVAVRSGPGAWDTTTVPGPSAVGGYALALGPGGGECLSVTSSPLAPADQKALRYFERQPDGSWRVEVADSSTSDKGGSSIAVDVLGDPVIAYNDQDGLDLKVAIRKHGVWTSGIVDAFGNTGYYASLAVDASSRPVVTYQRAAGSGIMLAAFGSAVAGVERGANPSAFALIDVNPNPVRAGRPISFSLDLPRAARVSLEAFDVSGRRVAFEPPRSLSAGRASVKWDPALPGPGLYFLRVSAEGREARAKAAVVR